MPKGRFEAFSDGVIAILITIMVLELRTPDGKTWGALQDDVPVLLAYLLSFVMLGIYWNNHHHMLAAVSRISSGALWANLDLLFWLSLIPFVTAWMSENSFAQTPVAAYGIVLLAAGVAYFVLQGMLLRIEGPDSPLARALGRDVKGKSLGGDLHHRDRPVVRRPLARSRGLRGGGVRVAGAGPARVADHDVQARSLTPSHHRPTVGPLQRERAAGRRTWRGDPGDQTR